MDILRFSLPGGFLGAVASWVVSRRTRDNDMLAKLQASINLLADENRKILAENVQLRKENAGLKVSQEELIAEVSHLSKEIERLRKIINKQINETNNQKNMDPGNIVARRAVGTELFRSKKDPDNKRDEEGEIPHLNRLSFCRERHSTDRNGEWNEPYYEGDGSGACGSGEGSTGDEQDEPP